MKYCPKCVRVVNPKVRTKYRGQSSRKGLYCPYCGKWLNRPGR